MTRNTGLLACALAVAGCDPPAPTYQGFVMATFFPFDGERWWMYTQEGTEDRLKATLDPVYDETADGARVYTVTYTIECPDDAADDCVADPYRISQIKWSSDDEVGVMIHGVSGEATGEVVFNPPIQLAGKYGKIDDTVTTETGGLTWVGTFQDRVDCAVPYSAEFDDCVLIHLDDDGDPTTPGTHPLHGDYYAIAAWNVVAMQLTDDVDRWQLIDLFFAELED